MIAASFVDWIPGIIAGIGSGGIVASVVALLKVRPEAGQIVVTAAQGALIVQSGVIEELRKELDRVKIEYTHEIHDLRDELNNALDEIARLNKIIDLMKLDQDRHDGEVKELQKNKI